MIWKLITDLTSAWHLIIALLDNFFLARNHTNGYENEKAIPAYCNRELCATLAWYYTFDFDLCPFVHTSIVSEKTLNRYCKYSVEVHYLFIMISRNCLTIYVTNIMCIILYWHSLWWQWCHISIMMYPITENWIICATACWNLDQRKHQRATNAETLQWQQPSHECHGIWNHQQLNCTNNSIVCLMFSLFRLNNFKGIVCLMFSLFRLNNFKGNTKASHYWPFVRGIHQWPVDPLTKSQ